MKLFLSFCFFISSQVFAKKTTYPGVVFPTSKKQVLAPKNKLQLFGMSCSSSMTELKTLKDDGAQVKKGEKVCSFEYICPHFFSVVETYIRKQKALASEFKQQWKTKKAELEVKLTFARIAVRKAELSFKKAKFLARKDEALAKVDLDIARHNLKTQESLFKAESNKALAQKKFHEASLGRALQEQARLNIFKDSYTVLAGESFFVRHLKHYRQERKIKKNDSFPSGTPVIFLARDKSLSVEFFVEEEEYFSLKLGRKLEIESDGRTYFSKIDRVSSFTQALGFVSKDSKRADASDRVYTVFAKLGDTTSLQSGVDVRVRIL